MAQVHTAGVGTVCRLERDHVPEIEMLGHRLDEDGVWLETREIGVIDCFPLRAHRYQTG